ncbi:hypothetical protein [Streptomyces sp. NPDC014746]|uniref:hypothetical protein n=1 Tax=Streptomyces sp. NPDC014746 TaxID=3364904 RepID=UPI0036FF2089
MPANEPTAPRHGPPARASGDGLPGGRPADPSGAGPAPPATPEAAPAPPTPATAEGPPVPATTRAAPAPPDLRPYLAGAVPRDGAPSLGRSLALDDGDLVLDPGSRDLALVVGAEALGQALELAVATQAGSDRLNIRFGFDRLAIGAYAHDLPTRKEHLTMELVRCLSSDRRVTDVREVFFDDDPRFLETGTDLDAETRLRSTAAARAERRSTVYAVVDTVAGAALTLRAGGTP